MENNLETQVEKAFDNDEYQRLLNKYSDVLVEQDKPLPAGAVRLNSATIKERDDVEQEQNKIVPKDENKQEKNKAIFIPEKEDYEQGEGGVFGNAVQAAANGAVEALNQSLEAVYQASTFLDHQFGGNVMPESLPDIPLPFDVPDTLTNNVIQSATQFIVPFGVAGKAMKAASLGVNVAKSFPKAMKVVRPMIQGAIADFSAFDGHEKRLSNLIQNCPALANPVNEYLAADDSDFELEGRFKNAVEGLGFGVLADAVFKGIKSVKAARKTRREAIKAGRKDIEEQFIPKVTNDDLKPLGDLSVQKEMYVEKSIAESRASTGFDNSKQSFGKKVNINFARIDTPDDVKKIIDDIAQSKSGEINAARRGKMTFDEIKLNAEQENAWGILSARRQGEPLNAEQSFAVRQLWVSSANKVKELSELVTKNPSTANLFMLRKQMETHSVIQKEVIAARTETARALAQWRIPAGNPAEVHDAMQSLIDQAGGDEVVQKMAKDILSMTAAGREDAVEKAIEKGWFAKAIDTWNEARIAGLLNNPTTHIVNFASNMLNVGVALVDDVSTAGYAKMFGADNSAKMGDAFLRLQGNIEGIKDGLRCAWQTIKTGASNNPYGTKFDIAPTIRSETYGLAKDSFFGRVVDFVGKLIRLPYAGLEAADDFSKAVHGRGALYYEATQKARNELFNGKVTADGFKQRIAELVNNPTDDLILSAKEQAEYFTFTGEPTNLTKLIGKAAKIHPLVRFVLPFTKTPGNVFDFALQHSPFAPLSTKFRQDVLAGGAKADRAWGQMATGVGISMVGIDLALNGFITGGGPTDPAERQALLRTGWQPYSIHIGDKYYSFSRFEPIATDMSLMADIAEYLQADRYTDIDLKNDEDTDVATLSALLALKVGNNVMNKTYMSGLMNFISSLSDPNERNAGKFASDLVVSATPGLSSINALASAVARSDDPYAKDVADVIDRMKANLPGYSKEVTNRLDIFGRKMMRGSGSFVYDMFIPVRKGQDGVDPIDREMLKQGVFVSMPARKLRYKGGVIDLSHRPALYNEFVALAGNELKLNNDKGCKDFLNEVITGDDYGYQEMNDGGPDVMGSKAEFISEIIRNYRQAALNAFLEKHPELVQEAVDDLERKIPEAI